MPGTIPIILHERQANWARQVRPRVASWPVRVHESRSALDLEKLVVGGSWPVLLVDLGETPRRMLEDLDRVLQRSPDTLSLVIAREGDSEALALARELGATMTLEGHVLPPEVIRLLERWVRLARKRLEAEGWIDEMATREEPWDGLLEPE